MKKNFWLNFSKYCNFSPASASDLKLREKGQMVQLCRILARGYPLGIHFWNFWPILAKTNLKNQKIVPKNAYFSQSIDSNCTKTRLQAPLETLNNIVLQCRIAPGTLEWVIAAQSPKILEIRQFLVEKSNFSKFGLSKLDDSGSVGRVGKWPSILLPSPDPVGPLCATLSVLKLKKMKKKILTHFF